MLRFLSGGGISHLKHIGDISIFSGHLCLLSEDRAALSQTRTEDTTGQSWVEELKL